MRSLLFAIFSILIMICSQTLLADDTPIDELEQIFEENGTLFDRLSTLESQGQKKYISDSLPPLASSIEKKFHKFQATLIRGAIVKKIDEINNNRLSIKKRIFVWGIVYEDNPREFIILDKAGTPRYTTSIEDIIPIQTDISINATPKNFIIFPQLEGPHTIDKIFKMDTYLSFGYESVNYEIAKEYNRGETSTSTAMRETIVAYFPFKFPIKPGIHISHQHGIGESTNYSYSWQSIELGPSFRYRMISGKDHTIDLTFFAGRSLYNVAEFEQEKMHITTNYFGLAIEDVISTKLGGFTLGVDIRYYDIKNQDSLVSTTSTAKEKRGSSIAIFIGKEIKLRL